MPVQPKPPESSVPFNDTSAKISAFKLNELSTWGKEFSIFTYNTETIIFPDSDSSKGVVNINWNDNEKDGSITSDGNRVFAKGTDLDGSIINHPRVLAAVNLLKTLGVQAKEDKKLTASERDQLTDIAKTVSGIVAHSTNADITETDLNAIRQVIHKNGFDKPLKGRI